MTEKIYIKNFSIIKDVQIELKNFNILIGEQATGKSLISKLIFYFKGLIISELTRAIIDRKNIKELQVILTNLFVRIFPTYFWEHQKDFKIIFYYKIKETRIEIYRKKTNIPEIDIIFADRITRKYKEISDKYYKINLVDPKFLSDLENDVNKIFNSEMTFFTPAGRSFFSLLKNNIFSLTMLGIDIDFFITQFGAYYEKFKQYPIKEDIKQQFDAILKGELFYDKKQKEIFIYTENQKSKLKDSSTGQQELVPIFILLNTILYEQKFRHFLIIEEPGAHLYPKTQKRLVELFAFLSNITDNKTGFLLTTHSPYILTTVSNLVQADNIYKQNPEHRQEINKIIDKNFHINFNNVTIYSIENGQAKSLLDTDIQNITADAIDDVSDELATDFDKLLNFL